MDDRFRELLKTRDYIIFDGAMGTMLQAAGMKMGETPEVLNITRPELLVSIAEQYYNAGSDVVYANTFGANRYKLEECGKSVEELVTAGIVNAKKARDEVKPDGLVALDVGPIGQLLEPTGVLSFEEAYDMYAEIVKAGAAAGADLVVFETMTDLLDVKAAVLAAKENSDLPIVATMTFEQNMRTFTGCAISSMALTLTGLGVDAIGVNCSLGPKELEPVVEELVKANIITEEEAKTHPRRNHITRAIGTDEMVIVDIFKKQIDAGNKILLTSDGLTGFVDDNTIKDTLLKDEDVNDLTKELINTANDVSGRDNISVILIEEK